MKGPDGKREGNKTDAYAFLVTIPSGRSATFEFSKNAGTEIAGLLHELTADRHFHRSGNPRKEEPDSMDGTTKAVQGPKEVWVTGWFKQPGWKHDAGWQQQRLKVLADTGPTMQLGFEDHWGSPGTEGNIDWNDLIVTVKMS